MNVELWVKFDNQDLALLIDGLLMVDDDLQKYLATPTLTQESAAHCKDQRRRVRAMQSQLGKLKKLGEKA